MARRNPDEEIRAAARRYLVTRDPSDKMHLVNLQRRAGLTCQAEWDHPGSIHLVADYCDYCGAFVCEELCNHVHHKPLPEGYSNQCVLCEAHFSDENPCWNSRASSSCFRHFHKEGYCRPCWALRRNEIRLASPDYDDWEPDENLPDPDYDDCIPDYDN